MAGIRPFEWGRRLSRLHGRDRAGQYPAPWASVNTDKQLAEVQDAAQQPIPNGMAGRYYGKGGAKTVLTEIRVETLKRYGIDKPRWRRAIPTPGERETAIHKVAADWGAQMGRQPSLNHSAPRPCSAFDTQAGFSRRSRPRSCTCYWPQRRAVPAEDRGPDVIKTLGEAAVEARYFRDRQRPSATRRGGARARQMVAGPCREFSGGR